MIRAELNVDRDAISVMGTKAQLTGKMDLSISGSGVVIMAELKQILVCLWRQDPDLVLNVMESVQEEFDNE